MHAPAPGRSCRRGNASDLAFAKVVAKCSSFIIACQGHDVTKRNRIPCLGNLSQQQMDARQTHLLPEHVRKSIAFLRIWVRRPAPARMARTPLLPPHLHPTRAPAPTVAADACPPPRCMCVCSAWPR